MSNGGSGRTWPSWRRLGRSRPWLRFLASAVKRNIFSALPHVIKNCSVMEYFFEEKHTSVLAEKVNNLTQAKAMIYDLKDSILKVCDNDEVLQDFARKVKDLFNLEEFIQAIVDDTYFTDHCAGMVVDMDSYENEKEPMERWESLQPDISFLKGVLKAKHCFLVTRGVLCVLCGYWVNEALRTKVKEAICVVRIANRGSPDDSEDDVFEDGNSEDDGFKDGNSEDD